MLDEDFKKIAEEEEATGHPIPDANSNVKRNNKEAIDMHDQHQFFSKEVGTVRPISGAIPTNRHEYQAYIEKPTASVSKLNREHGPLGRWLIRSASGKQVRGKSFRCEGASGASICQCNLTRRPNHSARRIAGRGLRR